MTIKFSDPLDGENRIDNNISSNAFCRKLITARIDTLLNPYGIKSIDLLKIDIEGSAAKALRGAPKMLSITKNVVLEYHSEAELGDSVNLLVANGFHLRRFRNRNLWFRRA